ncbi:hypothetical protein [Gayadomonas joobiniege]|uniref:hypothetical protein n=1 Tax=Gayadomonas joobiniege TaxID=1234606 RepID=UPI00037C4D09|nr:hypothetical protein [Gayadomonas joobiniege]
MKSTLLTLTLSLILLSACSTREKREQFSGSTEQRLVTYSIQEVAKAFTQEPLDILTNKSFSVESYFLLDNYVVDFAEAKIVSSISEAFNAKYQKPLINYTGEPTEQPKAEYTLKLFFNSLGTDRDQAGFSFPLINLSEPEKSTSISLLAVDMYHGISECEYILVDSQNNEIVYKGHIKARVRTDNFTTPIFSFPLSDLD